MILVFSVFFAGIAVLLIVLWMLSPGKPVPFVDQNGRPLAGSISEKTFITIGGVKHGMVIKSKNKNNPVLLYLHGGIPDFFLTQKYPTGLDDYFTVVWWDQQGSGLSYNKNLPVESITLDLLISDTHEITNYLRHRFGKEKIYLMGRSGGTYIGMNVAAKFPELYHAYIGVGQMSDHFESEKLAHAYMLKTYAGENRHQKIAKKLANAPVSDIIPYEYLKVRDKAMHQMGIGTTRNMNSVITGLFLPSLMCRELTLKEKINLWRGKAQSGVHPLWDTIISTNLITQITELTIPVYFFHGVFDYTVSYPLAKKYFEALQAPVKGFYTFKHSAHSPHFEEPGKMRYIIVNDVLSGKNELADLK